MDIVINISKLFMMLCKRRFLWKTLVLGNLREEMLVLGRSHTWSQYHVRLVSSLQEQDLYQPAPTERDQNEIIG